MERKKPEKEQVSEWYLKTCKDAELFDYGPVKGTIVFRPYGFAIWEQMQKVLDKMIKDSGHKNVCFPSLIPYSFLSKEKEHTEGFSPQCAVVTHAGGQELEEPLVVRPTSETIMYNSFSKWIQSWRDLPFKINQWANIVRWEMRPYPFLRTTEFLWQEGHTAHASLEDAEKEMKEVLGFYTKFFEEYLAIPVLVGRKTENEKFAGAIYTDSCEAMMIDGKALQIATVHNLGQKFAKVFDVRFQNESGEKELVWQTSWGLSTRAIGGLIMTHGDLKGLMFPPKIAPIQAVIVPIWKTDSEKKDVFKLSQKIYEELKDEDIRVELDKREQFTPGWKFNDWEFKGVPIRIEIGPKEVEQKKAIVARRDNGEKNAVKLDRLEKEIENVFEDIQKNLFEQAKDLLEKNIFEAKDMDEFSKILNDKKGFIKAYWCENLECEQGIREKTKATPRNIPFDEKLKPGKCVYCGKEAKVRPIWAKSY